MLIKQRLQSNINIGLRGARHHKLRSRNNLDHYGAVRPAAVTLLTGRVPVVFLREPLMQFRIMPLARYGNRLAVKEQAGRGRFPAGTHFAEQQHKETKQKPGCGQQGKFQAHRFEQLQY